MKGLLLSSVAKVEENNMIVSPAASKGFLTPDNYSDHPVFFRVVE